MSDDMSKMFWLFQIISFCFSIKNIFGDQNSGKSRVMATILQLKVTRRRLFEKVSLERCLQCKLQIAAPDL